MSRALGDLKAGCLGVIPTPQVAHYKVCPDDHFMIIASDGVWEFIDSEEAVKIVAKIHAEGGTAEKACRFLIAKAAICWRHFEGEYRDDITAIVVYLKPVVEMLIKEKEAAAAAGATASG
jgi:serine/threonine protein phosphatase PrpC